MAVDFYFYRDIINSIDEGFCIIDVVFDEAGKPVDWLYLEANPQFASQGGAPDAVGQLASVLYPAMDSHWFDFYGSVAVSGRPARLEGELGAVNKWYDVYAFKIGGEESRRVGATFRNITDRKRVERTLRENERQRVFLLDLGDRLREIEDAEETVAVGTELVGRHLSANGVVYCEIDPTGHIATVRSGWTDGTVPKVAGSYRLDDFGIGEHYRRGLSRRTEDVTAEYDKDALDRYDELRVRALLGVPVLQGHRLVGILAAHNAQPRTWTELEEMVVRAAGDRIWAAVEHSRSEEARKKAAMADEALRESEKLAVSRARELEEADRQKADILESISDCFYALDKDLRFAYVNKAAEEIWGMPRAELLGRRIEDVFAGLIDVSMSKFRQALVEQMPQHYEVFSKVAQKWGDMSVCPTQDGISVYFRDTTDRKRADEALRRNEERQAYLLKLSDALRPLSDAQAIQDAATRLLADHLGASQSNYTDYLELEEYGVVSRESANDPTISIIGSYKLSDFSASTAVLYSGGDLVIPDVAAFPAFSEEERAQYLALNIHANATVPLIKEGELVATLTARQTTPRNWTPDEVELVRETAERTWAAVVRAKAERALKENAATTVKAITAERQRLYDVLETLPVMVCLLTPDYHVVFANRTFREKFGESGGRHCYEYCCGYTEPCAFCEAFVPLRTGQAHHWEYVHPNGGTFVDVYDLPFSDTDGSPLILEMDIDITERKHAEADLSFQAHLLSIVHDAIIAVDENMDVTYWNAMAEAITGWTAAETVGQTGREVFHSMGVDLLWPEFTSRIDEAGFYSGEISVLRKDGSPVTIDLQMKRIHGPGGQFKGSVSTFRDVTERKRAEGVLRRSEERLRESEQKALALVARLEEADKNKNQFISVLSHELRNPLAVIVASLSLLEVASSPDQISMSEESINRQVGQLRKLVDDLLDLTRINQNKIKLKRENIDLNEVLAHVSQDLEPECRAKGVQLNARLQKEPVLLSVDPARIAQCVGNLLQNAMKYTQATGEVTLSLEIEDCEAVIRVQDNGIGIGPELLQRVFEPFTQADTSLDRPNGGGLGLGLSIVDGIVRLHGGSVAAFSEGIGKGSLFTIRLPISVQAADTRSEEFVKEAGRTYRILLIEDNRNLTDVLCSIFCVMGHQAFAAHSGPEGISEARRIRPDVVFCDIGLPGLNGYEVARTLRADVDLRNAFLIALTGYAGEYDFEQARHAGFDRYLAKPVDMKTLERILGEIAG